MHRVVVARATIECETRFKVDSVEQQIMIDKLILLSPSLHTKVIVNIFSVSRAFQ